MYHDENLVELRSWCFEYLRFVSTYVYPFPVGLAQDDQGKVLTISAPTRHVNVAIWANFDLGTMYIYASSERKYPLGLLVLLRTTKAKYWPFLHLLGMYHDEILVELRSWCFEYLRFVSTYVYPFPVGLAQQDQVTISPPAWHVLDRILDEFHNLIWTYLQRMLSLNSGSSLTVSRQNYNVKHQLCHILWTTVLQGNVQSLLFLLKLPFPDPLVWLQCAVAGGFPVTWCNHCTARKSADLKASAP